MTNHSFSSINCDFVVLPFLSRETIAAMLWQPGAWVDVSNYDVQSLPPKVRANLFFNGDFDSESLEIAANILTIGGQLFRAPNLVHVGNAKSEAHKVNIDNLLSGRELCFPNAPDLSLRTLFKVDVIIANGTVHVGDEEIYRQKIQGGSPHYVGQDLYPTLPGCPPSGRAVQGLSRHHI